MRSKLKANELTFDITAHHHNEIGLVALLSTQEERELATKIEANYSRIFEIVCTTKLEDHTPKRYGIILLRDEYRKFEIRGKYIYHLRD